MYVHSVHGIVHSGDPARAERSAQARHVRTGPNEAASVRYVAASAGNRGVQGARAVAASSALFDRLRDAVRDRRNR